jgi:hypothetical protein
MLRPSIFCQLTVHNITGEKRLSDEIYEKGGRDGWWEERHQVQSGLFILERRRHDRGWGMGIGEEGATSETRSGWLDLHKIKRSLRKRGEKGQTRNSGAPIGELYSIAFFQMLACCALAYVAPRYTGNAVTSPALLHYYPPSWLPGNRHIIACVIPHCQSKKEKGSN